jgi:hypothetical protein
MFGVLMIIFFIVQFFGDRGDVNQPHRPSPDPALRKHSKNA